MDGSSLQVKEGGATIGGEDWPPLMGKEPLDMERGCSSIPGCSENLRGGGGGSFAQLSGNEKQKAKVVNE
jgi:hypothetical protein